MMQEEFPNNPGHNNVLLTFNLALKRLKENVSSNNSVLKILKSMAYIDGKEIKKGFLLKLCNHDKFELIRALQTLFNYSLISKFGTPFTEFAEQVFSVHSLVQMALQFDLGKSKESSRIITDLLNIMLNGIEDPVTKDTGKNWSKHFVYMVSQTSTEDITYEKIKDIQILDFLREVLILHSRYKDAENLFSKIALDGNYNDEYQIFGMLILLQILFSMGNWMESHNLISKILNIKKGVT